LASADKKRQFSEAPKYGIRSVHADFEPFLAGKAHGYCVLAFLFDSKEIWIPVFTGMTKKSSAAEVSAITNAPGEFQRAFAYFPSGKERK
jgi:hypothetical protein